MIIAVDADGVLWKDNFPFITEIDMEMASAVRHAISMGHEVILWTCRTDKPLERANYTCQILGLDFVAVNENAPSNIEKWAKKFPGGTRKVYADLYIDDKALGYDRDDAIQFLNGLTRVGG